MELEEATRWMALAAESNLKNREGCGFYDDTSERALVVGLLKLTTTTTTNQT